MWLKSPYQFVLKEGEIHLWKSSLDLSPDVLQKITPLLSEEEIVRADRFHFEKDRNHFIAGRGMLRILLANYLSIKAEEVPFQYGHNGKPFVGDDSLTFNISHALGVVVFAFTLHTPLGIDVESNLREIELDLIANHFFSPAEAKELFSLPTEGQTEGFYRCWTRKEALIKAKGDGLSLPLNQFEVSLLPGEEAQLKATHWDPEEAKRWSLFSFSPEKNFIAALAIECEINEPLCFDLDEAGILDLMSIKKSD